MKRREDVRLAAAERAEAEGLWEMTQGREAGQVYFREADLRSCSQIRTSNCSHRSALRRAPGASAAARAGPCAE